MNNSNYEIIVEECGCHANKLRQVQITAEPMKTEMRTESCGGYLQQNYRNSKYIK